MVEEINGENVRVGDILDKHKLLVVVNVASKWAFAHKSYTELVNVYQEYANHGLQLLAFPCNEFMNQEYIDEKEILNYARNTVKATFPIMKRCDVNGEDAHPIFKHLRSKTECFMNLTNGKIKNIPWNFSKFIIDSEGNLL